MKTRDIRYAEPPASCGEIGQKVRTLAELLDGRLGTCLDTTLVMAAVLEQCVINSTIGLIESMMVIQSAPDSSFERARYAPRTQHLASGLSIPLGITDVSQTRRARNYRLPSRSTDANDNVVGAECKPGAGPMFEPYAPTGTKAAAQADHARPGQASGRTRCST